VKYFISIQGKLGRWVVDNDKCGIASIGVGKDDRVLGKGLSPSRCGAGYRLRLSGEPAPNEREALFCFLAGTLNEPV
jgi:hypothetical protein